MELWVRSQDKEFLGKVEWVAYDMTTCQAPFTQFYKIRGDKGVVLGTYDSKERCLEILDEIQQLLCNTPILVNEQGNDALDNLYGNDLVIVDNDAKIVPLNTFVYQMPEK